MGLISDVVHALQVPVNEVPEIILQCVSRDEAALAIAQKVSSENELKVLICACD